MSDLVSRMIADMPIPRMAPVKQHFPAGRIEPENIPALVREQLLRAGLASRLRCGQRVAITAGSRGISNIAAIIKAIVDTCQELNASPFIVAAMGSHGGATACGQRAILQGYGITEASMGCPVLCDMDTLLLAHTPDGYPVYLDRNAAQADAIIACGRIKPHTTFRGPIESGLMKMLVAGLGKQKGADNFHQIGYANFARQLPLFGQTVINHAPVIMGLAIVENAFDETMLLQAVPAEEIERQEPLLLEKARAAMAKIYLERCDVLVVDKIGKDISGDGMDPNITGAFVTPYAGGGLQTQRIAVLDLSQNSRNPLGIGVAQAITQRLYDKADFDQMYMNTITANTLQAARTPLVVKNDKEALQVCLKTCAGCGPAGPSMIRIADTLHLQYIAISENLLPAAKGIEQLEILGPPGELSFDACGNLF